MRARRLARSALTERSSSLVDVVRQVGGIHAQVQASAELQLAARVDGIAQGDVRDALWRDRTLVKAWTMRGTLHLHVADELPLWHAATAAGLLAQAFPSALDGLNARTYGPPGLEEDIAYCAREDVLDVVPELTGMEGSAAEIMPR